MDFFILLAFFHLQFVKDVANSVLLFSCRLGLVATIKVNMLALTFFCSFFFPWNCAINVQFEFGCEYQNWHLFPEIL